MKYISDLTDLHDDEVLMFENELIKVTQLKGALDGAFSLKVQDAIGEILNSHNVKVNVEKNWSHHGRGSSSYTYGKNSWLQEGVSCEVLKLGAPQWQKGKLRLKVSLEFLPDEPENKKLESAIDATNESPLDEIRQLLN